MKDKKDFEDDGRQIADMSGVYDNVYGLSGGFRKFRHKVKENKKSRETDSEVKTKIYEEPMTKKETRRLMLNALLAGLFIGTIFIVGALIFILFTLNVWLK